VIEIVPPARAAWLDLGSHTETVLDAGAHPEPSGQGFLWIDLELPAPAALAALAAGGLVPTDLPVEEGRPDKVEWRLRPDHAELTLAGARLEGDVLRLDQRRIVAREGLVVSLHRGLPGYFEEMRARYADDFARFARSHGFLLFEMVGHLADGLQAAVHSLADRIDDLRLAAAGGGGPVADGSELLGSVLVLRRILARTRDLLAETSSRRTPFIPETTQPYLRDIGDRLDGVVADLAFSRAVLDEVLRLAEGTMARPPGAGERAEAAAAMSVTAGGRPLLLIHTLGDFRVLRGGAEVHAAELGGVHGRELLAALLCAGRAVRRDQLLGWLWPGQAAEPAGHALAETVASVRRGLDPSVLQVEGASYRIALAPGDTWDVDELRGAAEELDAAGAPAAGWSAALERLGGPLCSEWPHAEWGRAAREDCARAAAALRGGLATALLREGATDEARAHLEALVEADPENEEWHRALMRCHARAGDMPLALRQFHACRSVLRQTQGVDPGPETEALYLELLGGG
jgi:DNA-binding SARP family transcriptional activator/Mg2+ and Co2+ transporter CorA